MSNKNKKTQEEQVPIESSVRFQALFELSADAYLIMEDGVFIDCNQATVDMLRASSKEVVLSTHPAELSPDFQPDGQPSDEMADKMTQIALDQGSHRFEWMHRRVDGEDFPVEVLLTAISLDDRTIIHTVWRDITNRKQTEQTLLESQRLLQLVMDNIPQAVFWKSKDLVYLGANQAFAEDAGLESADEIAGKTDFDMPWTEQAELYRADDQQVMDKGEDLLNYEEPQVNATGETTWLRTSKIPMKDEEGNVFAVLGMYEDITEQRTAAQALEENQRLLQLVMDNIPQAVFWKSKDLVYLGANQAFAEDAGLESADEIAGKTDFDLPWTEQAELYRTDDQQVMDKGENLLNYEEPQVNATGETTWLRTSKIPMKDAEGNVFAVLGMYEDITASKQADQALTTQRHFLRQVIDTDPNFIFVKDRESRFVLVNQAMAEAYGSTTEELIGKSDADFNPNIEEVEHFHLDDLEVIDGQMEKFIPEEPITTASGETRWLQTIKRPLVDEDGVARQLLGVATDISERKFLELSIQEAFERRGSQVQISTEISQEIAKATELTELFDSVVDLTKERLGYYHTQLLRYRPTQDAVVLISGYGETGQQMAAEGHRMPMGSGLIGTAAETGETVMRPDLAADPDWQPNPLLPDTRGEMAVPIKLGDDVLGILDVQSDQAGVLTEDDRLLLEGLCGQIAIAMEQTRLRQEMAERLDEINRLYRTMSREGWGEYQTTTTLPEGFQYDQAGVRVLADEAGPQSLVAAPLTVPGGHTVGTLAIADDPENPLSPEDQNFLEQVSEQVALALESARLFEQTQAALDEVQRSEEALREVSGLQTAILEGAEYAIISATPEGILTTFNPGAENMLGYKAEEVINKESLGIFHDLDEIIQRAQLFSEELGYEIEPGFEVFSAKARQNLPNEYEWTYIRKDGSRFPALLTVSALRNEQDEVTGFLGIAGDITERKQAEEATTKRAAELATVADVGTRISTILEEQELLETVVNLTRERFDLYHCHIFLSDEHNQTLQVKACGWDDDSPHTGTVEAVLIHTDQEQSLVAQAARNQQAVIVNDVRNTPDWLPNELLPNTHSEMAIPMVAGNQVLGVLDVQSEEVDRFNNDDISIMTTLASQVAVALQNARTYARTQQQAEHEAMINLISQRIQSTTSVENALQVAIRELGRALGAKRTNVQLGLPSENKSTK